MIEFESIKILMNDKRYASELRRKSFKNLVRIAAYAKKTARNSIKKPTKRTANSRPGRPPISRTGLLRRHIYFYPDWKNQNVVIGPARLGGTSSQDIPGDLEKGRIGMAPRPYMGPALEKSKDQLKDLLT